MGGDPRVAKLARVLVRYSVGVRAGDLFQINAPALAAPLIRELYRAYTAIDESSIMPCHSDPFG